MVVILAFGCDCPFQCIVKINILPAMRWMDVWREHPPTVVILREANCWSLLQRDCSFLMQNRNFHRNPKFFLISDFDNIISVDMDL